MVAIVTLVPPSIAVNNRVLIDYVKSYTHEGTK